MRGETREYSGMRCAYKYVGMTGDETQRCRLTFYEVVKFDLTTVQQG